MNNARCEIKFIRIAVMITLIAIIAALFSVPAAAATDSTAQEQKIESRAKKIVAKMTLDQKIGQMMLVTMPKKGAVSLQKKQQYGGYILFAKNFADTSKSSLKKRIQKCQKASKRGMLIAVDEEGGRVVRASYYAHFRKNPFPTPRAVYRASGYDGIVTYTKEKDSFLASLGINTNLAPVADVPYKKSNYMYDRGFSTSAPKTSKFIRLTVQQMGKDDIVCCLKHFPGYGGNADTHGKIARDRRPLKTFETRDLRPFRKGVKHGADMVMVSHIMVKAFDSKRPASLSKKVHKYLRNEVGFDGVIITDGLGMEGIRKFVKGDSGKAAVKAVKAGSDMLCVTTTPDGIRKALKKAVKKGSIREKRIDRSVQRIVEMKLRRGIIE